MAAGSAFRHIPDIAHQTRRERLESCVDIRLVVIEQRMGCLIWSSSSNGLCCPGTVLRLLARWVDIG